MAERVRILGIDPGSRITGYGVIDVTGDHAVYVSSGQIQTAGQDFHSRLLSIYTALRELVLSYCPDEIAVERVFVHRNVDSALKLGQARGAALCAVLCDGGSLHEYAPRQIKRAVVGNGNAAKQQVQHMVRVLLALHSPPQADAADALAVALCHGYARRAAAMLRSGSVRG